MGFLEKLLNYKKVCIQCHNNPDSDAIASAFGVYRYLQKNGIEALLVKKITTMRLHTSGIKTLIGIANLEPLW